MRSDSSSSIELKEVPPNGNPDPSSPPPYDAKEVVLVDPSGFTFHGSRDDIPLLPSPPSNQGTLADRIQQIAFARGLKTPAPPNRVKSINEFVPIQLCWEDVDVEVKVQKGKNKWGQQPSGPPPTSSAPTTPREKMAPKVDQQEGAQTRLILNKCSGYVKPGSMLAIMGSSGAGKTTLLNVLSGRSRNFNGKMWMNHAPFSYTVLKHSAFVQQSDLFYTQLSVYEHLRFQARLRLPSTLPMADKVERVEAVIQELGLSKVMHNRIGMVGMGGISGGERRRLSVGTEILTNPSLLFVDEPTTGLDSFMAEEVIQMLKKLASRGRTVVCTIHQPSSEIYALFDNVMFLAEGRVTYFGSLPYAIEYFSRLNFVCPSWSNPSDYFIKVLSIVPGRMKESKAQVSMFIEEWERSEDSKRIHHEVAAINEECDVKGMNKLIQQRGFLGSGEYNATWWEQFKALCWRVYVTSRRDPLFFSGRLMQSLVLGVLIGLIYLQAGDGQRSVQNKTGSLYFLLMNQAMNAVFNVQHSFPPEMSIVKREYSAGTYRSDVYFLAKTLVVLPMQLAFLIMLTTIAYWMIGFTSSALVWVQLMALFFLCLQSGLSLGYFISCSAPSQNVALAMAPVLLLPIVTFGGLTINSNSIPNYFYWLSYSSFMKYGYETAVVLVYSNVDSLNCDGSTGPICSYPDGQAVLDYFGFSAANTGRNIGALFALTIGFRMLAYYSFWRKLQFNPHQAGTIKKKSAGKIDNAKKEQKLLEEVPDQEDAHDRNENGIAGDRKEGEKENTSKEGLQTT